jgi:ABC-type proline/glycine betaine transport system permease subunit
MTDTSTKGTLGTAIDEGLAIAAELQDTSKSFLVSKTFWANVVGLTALIATLFGVDLGLDAATQAEVVTGLLAIVNIVLRFVSNTAVHVVPPAVK